MLIAAPPGGRVRLGGAAVAAAALLTLPMLIGDPSRFLDAQHAIGISKPFRDTVTASNVWWPFTTGSTSQLAGPGGSVSSVTQYSLPGWLGALTTPLVIALTIGMTAMYLRRRREADPEEALALLALIFLVRCLLDSLSYSYHHVPFLIALVAWEALRRRVPVLSLLTVAALALTTDVIAPLKDASLVNAFYLAWSIPLAAALGMLALAPEWAAALARRFRPAGGRHAPQRA